MTTLTTLHKQRKTKVGRVVNLGSSSDGNAFYIEIFREGYPNSFNLLIECGFAFNDLQKRLVERGLSINNIHAVLVTHEHNDHAKAVVGLFNRGRKIFAPESVFQKFDLLDKTDKKYIIYERKSKLIADGIRVLGMPLDHENDDGSKTYNLGYIITIDNEYKILFVTDTKHIRWDLSKYRFNLIFIEANNLHRVIHFALKNPQEKNDMGKIIHFKRVLHSHMLVEKTAKTLAGFDLSECETIILIHLSTSLTMNIFEFKNIVRNKLRKERKFRKIKVTNKRTGESYIKELPKILVATQRGSLE